MDFLKDFEIPTLNDDQNVEVVPEEGERFSLKNLINILIEFINKIIKFEF